MADRKKRNKRRCKQQERFNAFSKSQPQINPTSNIQTTFRLCIHIHVYDIKKIILFTINDIKNHVRNRGEHLYTKRKKNCG